MAAAAKPPADPVLPAPVADVTPVPAPSYAPPVIAPAVPMSQAQLFDAFSGMLGPGSAAVPPVGPVDPSTPKKPIASGGWDEMDWGVSLAPDNPPAPIQAAAPPIQAAAPPIQAAATPILAAPPIISSSSSSSSSAPGPAISAAPAAAAPASSNAFDFLSDTVATAVSGNAQPRQPTSPVKKKPGPAASTVGKKPGPAAMTVGKKPGPAAMTVGKKPSPAAPTAIQPPPAGRGSVSSQPPGTSAFGFVSPGAAADDSLFAGLGMAQQQSSVIGAHVQHVQRAAPPPQHDPLALDSLLGAPAKSAGGPEDYQPPSLI
jgi:hypothetical protein